MREFIPHLGLITKVISLKLFLDMVPSSSSILQCWMKIPPGFHWRGIGGIVCGMCFCVDDMCGGRKVYFECRNFLIVAHSFNSGKLRLFF